MKNLKNYLTELDEKLQETTISEAIDWHVKEQVPLIESIFRVGSEKYFQLFREAREMLNNGAFDHSSLTNLDLSILRETDLGIIVEHEGKMVPLDCPMIEEEEKHPPIGQPKRGGTKKFYVYVRKPDGGIKKVSWGDTTGLSVKMNNPERRKSFAARHKCSIQKDRTSAAYWACNTPRYAKSLGLSGGGNFYW
jgi:hypothetical protein